MKTFWQTFLQNPRVAMCLGWLGLITIVAILAPIISPGDPFSIVGEPFQKPFGTHLFGTDKTGATIG